LFLLAKEINLIPEDTLSKDIVLPKLRELFSVHPVFAGVTKLDKELEKSNIKLVWCPKYHCELNPIEGFWCYLKRYVRKNNDQNYKTFNNLIIKSMKESQESTLHCKLWNRFLECLDMYGERKSYQDVLGKLLAAKSSDKVQSHKKNKDFNTSLK
jgi:transposase